MDTLREIVEFRSETFAPALPEDAQVNEGVYGAELAYWLCAELARRGIGITYPQSEDWGWFLEHFTDSGSEFAVHCYNVDGSKSQWLLALRRHGRKIFGRDKPPYSEADRLITAIRDAVESTAVPGSVSWRWGNAV